MLAASATQKRIELRKGGIHGIDHFLKVWAVAKTIGELEWLDADFLVNAGEGGYTRSAIENFRQRVFRTSASTGLLDSMYLKGEKNL